MSDPVSALRGAVFEGFVTIREAGPVGMITIRGDLTSKPFIAAITKATGVAVPGQRQITRQGDRALAWMSPDELLLILPHGAAGGMVGELDKAMSGQHSLAVEVSDARAVFDITGAGTRDVLAKLMPVDFSAAAFGEGMIRRSRLAQVAAAVWIESDGAFRLVCFRSVARYVFDALSVAGQEGSEVSLLS